ncbi:lysine 2,3-aminomutase [Caldanaerobacter subterraneus subsp. tengcongensis MB4]|uniref:Lysine 2,3-aminomutase n=1 Tax=Caldanaerobacter subterraneus subsp. tengcongensis (strain DSM 15242 / JCM 11007 / NBRC 100824 / MB4) TaxID=273068 RepID=Q8RAK9_CALS4|nr:glutamate 2,3-aminomutase [Caldanaerobacter subterraneus]AAM24434.1 Lysine 2,3-aminomutase [Caldanaerobacter subterraneus subsp. tengcongensis MB4]MCS3916009.1 lysine 2,3-aminomutase [Caldanaerobacter subterraneus subsp. tengcongensis MB4]
MSSTGSLTVEEKRKIALQRAEELKKKIEPYLRASEKIETGFKLSEKFRENKEKIKNLFGATEEEWNDWRWQIRNRISDVETLKKIVNLSEEEIENIKRVSTRYRWAISPYYASLMDPDNPFCPIRMRAIPSIKELTDKYGVPDPMAEEYTSPAPLITRRYPDRLIINVTNQCGMFCRHCQRRRNIGEVDYPAKHEDIEAALEYIRNNPEIRDVLITGGDPLTLEDEKIDWILSELDKIPHVEIKRIGTAAPVTFPQRITDELCKILTKHLPLYINTQFNHPKEVTEEAKEACFKLARAGVALGNQAVLLKGINNDPHVMKKLNHELLRIMVKPYYIFHAKSVQGTTHFVTTVQDGLEIMEQLRGYTSGLAIPWYIINAPEGHGKTPIVPQYLLMVGKEYVLIRNWEGKVFEYPNGFPDD